MRSNLILAIGVVLLAGVEAQAIQYARPDGTISSGSWTANGAVTLHEAMDEVTANGSTDFIETTSDSTAEVSLTNVPDPGVDTGHVIRYNSMAQRTASTIEVALYQGAVLIATTGANTHAANNNYEAFSYTLSAGEAASITDYTDLRLRITCVIDRRGVDVTWAELEVPESVSIVAPTVATPSIASVQDTTATLGGDMTDSGGENATERGVYWSTTSGFTPPGQGTKASELGSYIAEPFAVSAPGLTESALIYFQAFETNSAGDGFSGESSFQTEPATQASSIVFSPVGENGMTISWSPASDPGVDGSIVIMKQGATMSQLPSDFTLHAFDTAFGNPTTELGGASEYVVYRGSGSSVAVTNLVADTAYYVRVFTYAGAGAVTDTGINYQQDGPPESNQTTQPAAPSAPTVSTPSIAAVQDTTATLGGDVNATGGENASERGIYWSTTQGFTPPGQGTKASEFGSFIAEPFTVSATGLTESALIYFQAFATNSGGNGFSSESSFQTEPTTQASSISFSLVGQNGMTINWLPTSDPSVDGSIVIMKQGTTLTQLPTDFTQHAFDTAFGNATTELGGAGEYVVYRGSAASVAVTNLVSNTLYSVRVFTYAGTGEVTDTGINYQQDGPQEAPQTTASPGPQPPTVITPSIAAVQDTTATLGGDVSVSESSPVTETGVYWSTTPGFTPPGQGTKASTTGADLGTGPFTQGVSSPPLTESALIYFKAFAVDGAGEGYSAQSSFQTEPTTQASSIVFSSVGENGMTISWSPASDPGVDGSIVIMKQGPTMTQVPTDFTEHAFDTAFGNATTELAASGEYVVYRGAAATVAVTNLVADTAYYVRVFTYAGTGAITDTGINYQQDTPPESNQTTQAAAPSAPTVSTPSIASVQDTTATLGGDVTDSGGENASERGIYWSTLSGFTPPGQGTKASELGSYIAEPFTVSATGLPESALIHFRAFATNGSGDGFSGESSFQTEPTTQASAVTFTGVTKNAMTVSWTAGSGDGVLVVMKAGSAVPVGSPPVDATEHAASAGFGGGADLGSLSYVVYRGSANSVSVSGLTADTTYYVKVFEYAGSGAVADSGINYQQDVPVESFKATLVDSVSPSHNALRSINCVQCHTLHSGSTIPTGIEQDTVCKACHNESQMGTGNPHLWDINMHVVDGGTRTVDCGSCHDVHYYDFNTDNTLHGGTTAENIVRIRWDTSKWVSGALEPAIFQQRPQHFAFFEATYPSGPFNGICQTCHQSTTNHTNDGWNDSAGAPANNNHQTGATCTVCHGHGEGFLPSGCTDCHNTTQDAGNGGPTRRAIVGEFSLTAHHVVGGGVVTNNDCKVCHYEAVDNAFHQDNKVDLRDPDTGFPITGFTKFTRDRSSDTLESWITNVQNNFCLKCHDGGANAGATVTFNVDDGGTALRPFSSTSRDVPIVYESFDPANSFHHAVRAPAANDYCIPSAANGTNITMEPPWNQTATHDQITCFDCHGTIVTDPDGTANLVSAHGGANQRMLRTPIDFDGIEAAGAAADIGLIPANARFDTETFCTTCHKSTVYVTSSDPEGIGSIYEYHGGSQSQHSAAGGNELACMGCHGGIVDFSTLSDNGAFRGNLHGDVFTWPGDSFASGTATERFMLGGWLSGWQTDATKGYCRGGECNHKNSSKNYTR